MKMPGLVNADELKDWDCEAQQSNGYVLARPIPFQGGIFRRVKLAWLVFTGKCDVLKWKNQ